MSSKSAKEYGAQGRSDVFMIDPRKVVIEEDDPRHKDFHAHEPRRVMQPRLLRLIRTRGTAAIGEVRVKKMRRDDGTTYVRAIDGRVRIRHARAVLVEKLTEMGADPETWEPSENDPMPLLVRAVPEQNDDATIILNAYQKRDPPLMLAQVCAEKRANNMPIEDIGLLINRSRSAVEKYLKLWDDGCDELKEALHADRVTFNAALRLCEKSHDKQREALAKLGERGKKLRGQAAEAAARGDEPDARPRFRAPAAKLAEEIEKLPEGPARTALEWAIGRSTVLTVEPHETIATSIATYNDGRDPDDVKEIDELKQEIEKLRADIQTSKNDCDASVSYLGAERERVKELEAEIEKLKRAEAVPPDVEKKLRDLKAKLSGYEEAKGGLVDDDEIVGATATAYENGECKAEERIEIVRWAAAYAVAAAVVMLDARIDETKEEKKEIEEERKEIDEKEKDIEAREAEIKDREEREEDARKYPPATDEEQRAAIESEVRFCARRGRLDELFSKKPALRAIARDLGLVEHASP